MGSALVMRSWLASSRLVAAVDDLRRRRLRRLLLTIAGTAVLVGGSAAAAQAGSAGTGGSQTGTGYQVDVAITFTGDAAPGGGGVRTVSVAPTCWWEQFGSSGYSVPRGDDEVVVPAVDGTDPAAMLAWYDAHAASLGPSSTVAGAYYSLPPREWFEAQIAGGQPLVFYQARCQDGVDMVDEGFGNGVYGSPDGFLGELAITVNAFPVGTPPPPPVITSEELALAAREVIEIEAPEIDRNPQVGSTGGGTLVGLPTRFWVTNPEAMGTGTKTITATLGTVSATLTATSGGLSLSSAAGATSCEPDAAMTQWDAAQAEGSGCSIAFDRASVGILGGFAVDASTAWTATWVGSDDDSGTIDPPLTYTTEVAVPVAEVQSLVQRAR